ncbi:MAG: alpha/beta fold hydrolase [Gammaproteobacteria bacterium]|nr:alpha/beta fold hydrolase [Gammaproteobacteria bacterium]
MSLPERQTVTLDHGEIAWREAGDGPALVLLHGLNGNASSWTHQYEAFADRFRVVGWDAPGYGGSDPHPAPGVAAYADAVAAWLDALGIQSCHLLGHSMGSLIAPNVAHRHPALVQRLVLSGARVGYRGASAEDFARRVADFDALSAADFGRSRAESMVSARATREVFESVAAVAAEVRREGYLAGVSLLGEADNRAVLADLDLPILAVAGSDDRIAPPDQCLAEIAASAPSARVVRIDGVAHAAYIEAPDRYNALLSEFLGD